MIDACLALNGEPQGPLGHPDVPRRVSPKRDDKRLFGDRACPLMLAEGRESRNGRGPASSFRRCDYPRVRGARVPVGRQALLRPSLRDPQRTAREEQPVEERQGVRNVAVEPESLERGLSLLEASTRGEGSEEERDDERQSGQPVGLERELESAS